MKPSICNKCASEYPSNTRVSLTQDYPAEKVDTQLDLETAGPIFVLVDAVAPKSIAGVFDQHWRTVDDGCEVLREEAPVVIQRV